MAIHSNEILSSQDCKKRIKKLKRKKIQMFGDGIDKCSTSSAASKQSNIKLNSRVQSPYLCQDTVNKINIRQLHRKQVSNSKAITAVHKANSDEIAIIQDNERKQAKKSVLTLPNHGKLTEMAQVTVSDMNESEYDNNQQMNHIRKFKKRLRFSRQRKQRVENNSYKYYDRDEVYCTQLDIDMNQSSTDMLNDISFNKRITKNTIHKNKQLEKDLFAGNIWAILKNINPFQFRPTPQISEESFVGANKKKTLRNKKCTEPRFLKTQNTESFAYISSVEMNSEESPCLSKSSSFDRITVIDKRNDSADSQESLEDSVIDLKFPKVHELCCMKNKNLNAKEIYGKSWSRNDNKNIITLPESTNKKEKSIKKDMLVFDNSDVKNSGNIAIVENVTYRTSPINYVSPTNKIVAAKELNVKSPVNTPIRHATNVTATEIEYIKKKGMDVSQKERKLRLVTTMPSTTMKMTQAEIKRRLAAIKFPIVVLGKDQLSSTVRVEEYPYPQFSGLDKHVWPFMVGWTSNGKNKSSHNSAIKNNNSQIDTNIIRHNKQVKTNTKSRMTNEVTKETLDKRYYNRPLCRHPDDQMLQNKINIAKRIQNPRLDITDKMVKLLYKKSSGNIRNNKNMSYKKSCKDNNNIDNSFVSEYVNDEAYPDSSIHLLMKKTTLPTKQIGDFKNVWSKSKYSSNLIDNVITKIKRGIYSNHIPVQKDYASHTSSIADKCTETSILNNDVIVQTRKTATNAVRRFDKSIKDNDFIEYFAPQNQFNNILKTIPGFNHTLPKLTIEELKQDQVVVKHCVKNVLIQFDISEMGKVDSRLQTTCCVPLTETSNNVYKCKNVILNATLPEQLCTVLPNIIRYTLQDKSINHYHNILNNNFGLFPISEVCTNESVYSVPLRPAKAHCAAILPSELSIEISMKNNNMANINTIGSFNRTKEIQKKKLKLKSLSSIKLDECKKLLTKLNVDRICSIEFITSNITFQREVTGPTSSCTAIVPYTGGNTAFSSSLIKNTNESSWALNPNSSNIIDIKFDLSNILNIIQCNNTYCLNLELTNFDFIERIKNSLYGNATIQTKRTAQSKILPYIQFYNNAITSSNSASFNNSKSEVMKEITAYTMSTSKCRTKNGKRTKVKANKKFPPITTISTKNKNLITLNTIRSVEEFFQVLGLEKKLTKVLNGQYSENILSSLAEMKKWVDDITPNQAFIILLLINKTQSANVQRCRSLILQGIAMNRITLASELDMEIEVIERENLNISTQHDEGNSYLPAFVESYDNILEEMYWIAKTTASDHQRPFNENTKKFIKSFLSKRKTQNPSYLRVMARYIGLGLLNTQGKYTTKQFK